MSYFGTLKGLISDTVARIVRVDASTHALEVIEYEHHEIHSGSSFYVTYTVDLGNGASQDILLVTPDTTKWAHMVGSVTTESEAHVYFYEDTTTSNDGTAMTEFNRNRNSGTAATVVATYTPTVTGVGTLIWESHFGSGRGVGGGARSENEFVLKQNTKYMLRVTNATANANYIAIAINWYEHTDKN